MRLIPVVASAAFVVLLVEAPALAAGKKGAFLQTDTLGMNVVNYQFDTGKTTTVGDAAVLSEFVGLHYFVIDRLRVGLNFQFSEQLAPNPATGSTFRTFAILPQVGWDFWGPLFVALVITVAPWTSGTPTFDFGLQAVFGVGIPITEHFKLRPKAGPRRVTDPSQAERLRASLAACA